MALFRPNPPPDRHGVSPSCVVTPHGAWATLSEFLIQRFPGMTGAVWQQRLAAGDVVDDAGKLVSATQAFKAGRRLYYFRAVQAEPPIPFEAVVLWQNQHLLVVDKPHFLPVLPSGKYVQETVLVRLKNQLGLPELSPIHRIDRDTAGVVLFSVRQASRDAYQALFRQRQVDKTYHAIAPWNPGLPWPITRASRIAPPTNGHFMQQAEVPGVPNSLTHIRPMDVRGGLAHYELKPVTGLRHQLRVHMNALGLPILNDGIYPVLTPEGAADFAKPLQLLAQSITFTDPISQQAVRFESQRHLNLIHLS